MKLQLTEQNERNQRESKLSWVLVTELPQEKPSTGISIRLLCFRGCGTRSPAPSLLCTQHWSCELRAVQGCRASGDLFI